MQNQEKNQDKARGILNAKNILYVGMRGLQSFMTRHARHIVVGMFVGSMTAPAHAEVEKYDATLTINPAGAVVGGVIGDAVSRFTGLDRDATTTFGVLYGGISLDFRPASKKQSRDYAEILPAPAVRLAQKDKDAIDVYLSDTLRHLKSINSVKPVERKAVDEYEGKRTIFLRALIYADDQGFDIQDYEQHVGFLAQQEQLIYADLKVVCNGRPCPASKH